MVAHSPRDGGLGSFAQMCLQLGEGVLERNEVGAVGWKNEQACTRGLDQLSDAWSLVARQVVHDHDVAWAQFGNQDLGHLSLERDAVDRAVARMAR